MLTMTLTTWLLAATPAPADAPVAVSFELQPAEQSRLSLALCFKGSGWQGRQCPDRAERHADRHPDAAMPAEQPPRHR